MPTKKVGCILVTSHLKQFLEDYPSSSGKQVFLDIYHMLSLLDKYLYDYPKQHTHCMSSDNEYVTLIQYAICFNIDLTTFPTLWAVLAILLNTQDGKCEYVKCLQEEYNNYYKDKSRRYMLKLERQLAELRNRMCDSVTHNFDRVSGLHDNGLTPSQMQDGDQKVEVTAQENAIDDDVIDIMTIYPPCSTDTDDLNDIDQMTNYKSMKDIRDELCKDMPQKTEINKPYIDNIDAYNRDRQLITASLSNKLNLGQNSLPGAQQIRVAVKHTDPISDFPEHLRQISLVEEIENISQTVVDGNVSLIPQVDGVVDSRDSLDRTPDSIDLTESPEKNTKTQKCIEKVNEDTSDNDTDEMITYKTDELKKSNRKNVNTAKKKGRMAKIYTVNIERKRLLKQRRERTLQNTRGKGLAEEYFLTALKASCKSYKASKNSHKRKKDNNLSINDDNTNIAMTVYDINNLEIVANHLDNATTNVKNADTESVNIDNLNMVETEIDNNDDVAKSNNNDDNPIMSDKESPLESPADNDIENDEIRENSTEEVPSPLIYGRKADDLTKVKSSKRRRPVKVTPLESPMGNPQKGKGKDKDATDTPDTYVFDPNDLQIHTFFLEGEPEGKELEGIEEEKLLEIHRAFQQKLKERHAE